MTTLRTPPPNKALVYLSDRFLGPVRADPSRRKALDSILTYVRLDPAALDASPDGRACLEVPLDVLAYVEEGLVTFGFVHDETLFVVVGQSRRRPDHRHLTVAKLRALIDTLPDDTLVIVSGGPDHTYRMLGAAILTVAVREDGPYGEWHGPEHTEGDPAAVVVLE